MRWAGQYSFSFIFSPIYHTYNNRLVQIKSYKCCMYGGRDKCIQGFGGEIKGKGHFAVLGVYEMIILRSFLRKWGVWAWTESIWFMIGTGGRHFRMR